MKRSDVQLKLFREGFDTYEKLERLQHTLMVAKFEIDKRISDQLGGIDDLDDIFTSDEQLRLKKLSAAIGRAEKDVSEKKCEYQKKLVLDNLYLDDDEDHKEPDTEDEFY
jgi:hypothetical protein